MYREIYTREIESDMRLCKVEETIYHHLERFTEGKIKRKSIFMRVSFVCGGVIIKQVYFFKQSPFTLDGKIHLLCLRL